MPLKLTRVARDLAADIKAATKTRAGRLIRAIDHLPPAATDHRVQQLQLMMQYRLLREQPGTLPDFGDVRFDTFSPDGEDGVLLYIFSLIGFRSRRCVDIGGAGITASNTANLVVNHEFYALVLDGNERAIARTARAYRRLGPTHPPLCVHAWVSRENINGLLAEHSMTGDIDLLSLDLDGVDWWILEALKVVAPRVIVVEYQDILGPDRPWTVPYRPDFSVTDHSVNDGNSYNYCGAGLDAFVRLLELRGYRLVGCNRTGYNAFFVKNGEGDDHLPRVEQESCFTSEWNEYGMSQRFPLVADMDWVTVSPEVIGC